MTYGELRDALIEYTASDGDALFAARIPTFVKTAEARFRRDFRLPVQESLATLTPANQVAALPSDFLEARSLTQAGDVPHPIPLVTPTQLRSFSTYGQAHQDVGAAAIEGSQIRFLHETDDTEVLLGYFGDLPALNPTDDASTNWLLSEHPDLYREACLAEAYKWLQEFDDEMKAEATYTQRRRELTRTLQAYWYRGAPLQRLASPYQTTGPYGGRYRSGR